MGGRVGSRAGAALNEVHQRARGALTLSFKRRGPLTVLDNLRQDGCLKARFPRPEPDAHTSAILLNSSGGIAAGDLLHTHITAGPETAATIATQAAERIYRALPGAPPATIQTRLTLAPGATLEWLPQETILFDHAALDRTLDITLAPDAIFTGLETLILGRTEMGEQLQSARITDRIRLHREGRLILHDAIRLHGPLACLASPCTTAGNRACTTLLHAAPDAAGKLEPMRQALQQYESGSSAWDTILLTRIIAPDMPTARRAVLTALAVLRNTRPMPRVWQL